MNINTSETAQHEAETKRDGAPSKKRLASSEEGRAARESAPEPQQDAAASIAEVRADRALMRGDSRAERTSNGPEKANGAEPMVRVPLSVFQKGSAELAALRARVTELEAELVEMPELRIECESLGDELHALRAVLGPESLPAHFERNPFTELSERARLLVEQVYGCDPRARDERQRAHDEARVEHIRTLERSLRVQVRDNRHQRQTLLLAADVLDDVITATAIGMAIPKPRIEKVAKAARLWTRAGGPCRVRADRAVVDRAVRRLVRWFGRTPGRASSELAWRSGSHLVAAVHAEFETVEALKTKTSPKTSAAASDELRDLRTKNEGMRKFLRKVSDALFDRQAGRDVSDTVMCALQSTASAWAGAGGHVPTTPTTTPAQVDLEEVIAAKAAAPAKPKKSRAKKAAPTTTPAQATSSPVSSGLDVRDGIMCDGAGGVWSSAEARRRDEIDPDWCPEPNWAPDGGRLRYLEEHEARGDAIVGCPDLQALADIRSGKRCALCGRRAWRGEHTAGCPNIDAPASA